MTKLFSIFAFICLMAFASSASAQSENGLVGQAKAAYQQQCGNGYNGPIDGEVSVVSACFVDGFITEVLLTRRLNCQQVDCDAVRLAPLARVTFGCDGSIISVECIAVFN